MSNTVGTTATFGGPVCVLPVPVRLSNRPPWGRRRKRAVTVEQLVVTGHRRSPIQQWEEHGKN